MARRLIQQLISIPGLRIECPNCAEEFPIAKPKLFSMYDAYPPAALKIMRERAESVKDLTEELLLRKRQLAKNRMQRQKQLAIGTQASNFGQQCEQVIPAFTTFPYAQGDCRILLKPIDYVVFTGLCAKGHVEAIKFVEFKTGGGNLGLRQRQIRNCVAQGKIKHEVIG
jgi:predicted Holliday junction resolvase-like endonuclease